MCSLNFPEIVPTTGSKNWCNVLFYFPGKFLLCPKWGKWAILGPKINVFEFFSKSDHYTLLKLYSVTGIREWLKVTV